MVWHGEEEERHNEWQGIMNWYSPWLGFSRCLHNKLNWFFILKNSIICGIYLKKKLKMW